MTARPRVALIGCGRIGKVHLRSLLAHPEACELALVIDSSAETVDSVATRYGISRTSTEIGDAFDDPTIDAVVIASSTETHAACIVEAARAGKAALCEKPVALDLETTDLALAAVQAAKTLLQVGFQRRFDRGYAHAHDLIASSALGNVEMIRDAMRDPVPPPLDYLKRSGGLFRDMTIHNFDCVRWLKGEDPVEVFAAGGALVSADVRDAGDIDTSVVTLRFSDGSLATIENSRRSGFGYDVRTEVYGSEAALHIGSSRDLPLRTLDAAGVHEDHQHFFLERFGPAYEAELLAFCEVVARQAPSPVPGHDGRAAMVLAIAAEHSLASNQPVNPAMVATATPKDTAHA